MHCLDPDCSHHSTQPVVVGLVTENETTDAILKTMKQNFILKLMGLLENIIRRFGYFKLKEQTECKKGKLNLAQCSRLEFKIVSGYVSSS